MNALFPSLAMLLHLIEPLTTPSQVEVGVALPEEQRRAAVTAEQRKQLCEVLVTFSTAYR